MSRMIRTILLLVLLLTVFSACTGGGQKRATQGPEDGSEATSESVDTESSAELTAPPTTENIAEPAVGERVKMTKWDLWSSGKTTLRGINIHQRLIYEGWDDPGLYGDGPVGPPFTQEDFDQLAALGANYVNISYPGLFSVDPPFELIEGAQANLDKLLEMIAKANMFAVISFRSGPGRSELTFWGVGKDDEMGQSLLNDSVWEDQAAQDAWVQMWRYTAERYQDNPVVVGYDLMVEPNSSAVFFDVYSPEEFYPAQADTLYDWNQFYPHIVEGIREVDPDTPILVGAMSFSQIDWLPYLKPTGDPRVVYTVHQYAPHDYTHQQPDEQGNLPNTYPGEMDLNWDGELESLDRDWLASVLSPVDEFRSTHGATVAVNEYGVMRFEPGAAQYLNDVMELIEGLGLNHALWAWTSAQALRYGQVQEFEYRLGLDLNNLTEPIPSELIEVIQSYWERNSIRPSQVTFISPGK